eukprot:872020-Lingulodinium_polyedra.AAC.1
MRASRPWRRCCCTESQIGAPPMEPLGPPRSRRSRTAPPVAIPDPPAAVAVLPRPGPWPER